VRENMNAILRRYILVAHRDEEGQALVEYALILGLVSVVAIALLSAVGGNITQLLARVTDALASAL
jgi:pilus assembly protein Flp/PilA